MINNLLRYNNTKNFKINALIILNYKLLLLNLIKYNNTNQVKQYLIFM